LPRAALVVDIFLILLGFLTETAQFDNLMLPCSGCISKVPSVSDRSRKAFGFHDYFLDWSSGQTPKPP